MSDSDPSPPPRSGPPHIRLNSGTHDLLDDDSVNYSRPSRIRPTGASVTSSRPATARPELQRAPSIPSYDGAAESTELLLPPKRTRIRRYRDESPASTPGQSRDPSPFSSRRTSMTSDTRSPFASPFDDSRSPSRTGSDDEELNTQTVSEKYNIQPSAGLLLFPEDVEKDDYLHNPDPNGKEDRDCDIFNSRGLVNIAGLAVLTLGLLVLFIGYPILNVVQRFQPTNPCSSNPDCINIGPVPLLKNIRTGLIDPDTPASAMSRTAHDGSKQVLVFSDEFNKDGRTFYDGDDPFYQGVDIWYGVTQDLEWYDPDAISTANGTLNIKFEAFQSHGLNYRSGMLQSWNKLCFKGGYVEASISLPGRGETVGFWPGFWAMGNLGRPGYAASTDGMWPYSYWDGCDAGITANQSSDDGMNFLPGMKLPACTCKGQDHPNQGKSRSAPEMDVLEASVGVINGQSTGMASQSAQFAPFDVWYSPNYDFVEVYDPHVTSMNAYRGGNFQQAFSGLSNLNNDWYEGKAYQKYGLEYAPGESGYAQWFIGDSATWLLDGRSLGANGNVGPRPVPQEPMALVVNFGMSNGFSAINFPEITALLPATMRIDYVRIYQDPNNEMMTCDPPNYPTTQYIREHPQAYLNPNKTHWSQTDYAWPQNSLVNGCSK